MFCQWERIRPYDYLVDYQGYVVTFTDGACPLNGPTFSRGGIGVWFGPDHPLNISEEVGLQSLWDKRYPQPTNNKAELEAACMAIEVAKEQGLSRLKILTDSSYVVGCVNYWRDRWEEDGWTTCDGKPVVNRQLIEYLYDLVDLECMEINVEFTKRNQSMGNIFADSMAKAGTGIPRCELRCDFCRVYGHPTFQCRKMKSKLARCAICRKRSHQTATCWYFTATRLPDLLLLCKTCDEYGHPTFKCKLNTT